MYKKKQKCMKKVIKSNIMNNFYMQHIEDDEL